MARVIPPTNAFPGWCLTECEIMGVWNWGAISPIIFQQGNESIQGSLLRCWGGGQGEPPYSLKSNPKPDPPQPQAGLQSQVPGHSTLSTCPVLHLPRGRSGAHAACCRNTMTVLSHTGRVVISHFENARLQKLLCFLNCWNAWRVVILHRRFFTTRCVWKQNMHGKDNHPLCDNYIGPLGGV